jgi:hypothetical protein
VKSAFGSVTGTTNPSLGTTTIQGEEDEPANGSYNKYWINLTFHKTDTGSYNAVGIAEYDYIYPLQVDISDVRADTGTVYISKSSSTNLTGTFNFVSDFAKVPRYIITNGEFNVNIQ